jgi:phage/plasmid-associated DNA primase
MKDILDKMKQEKKDIQTAARADPAASKVEDEASGFAKMLNKLRGKLRWRIYLVNGNRFIYRKTEVGYYETLVGPENPKDTLRCKMEIRSHFRNVPPSTIDNLFNAVLQEESRLLDGMLFVRARERGVPFLNGVFDLATGRLRTYRADEYYCDPIPHHLNETLNVQTIRFFRRVVREWVGAKNTRWFIDLTAYLLFMFPNVESVWVNPFGSGRNGKSSYIALLEQLLGKTKSIGINLADLNRHTSASFIGKSLIVGRDSDQFVSKRGISLIKNYSGDQYVIVEPKGGFQYDALVEGKLVVSTNYLIRSQDRSFGWYRRLLPVTFPNTFPQNPQFEKNLLRHVPGILTYLIRRVWKYKRGKIKHLTERIPRDIQILRLDTQFMNDRVAAFWDLEFFDEDGVPIVDEFLKLDKQQMSTVWNKFQAWHGEYFGDEEKVEPGRNSFCGPYGAFMEKASDYFDTERTRNGRLMYLRDEKKHELLAIPTKPEPTPETDPDLFPLNP